ncbi:MAG: hypothetical protein GQ574_08370 [Crocinitomix sp.]|nr:hypothetical protein [Crocinitomix sp.]
MKKPKQKIKVNSLKARVLKKEDIAIYLDALEYGVEEDKICNIALTGPYGSGKSSIIETFVENHAQYNFLNISLASFKEELADQNQEGKKGNKRIKGNPQLDNKSENLERLVELSILQQIFYHVKASQIPDSRFKRIINYSWEKIALLSVSFSLWFVAMSHLFGLPLADRFSDQLEGNWLYYSALGIFLLGIGYVFSKAYRVLANLQVKKLSVKGELEVDENLDQSILNKHIDEIIYFFEKTDFNIVIIEDLDRFESTEIFTKLREINRILNNSLQIGREIIFLYALRDEMFQGKERTKFFDLIIPVIPFINPSNASEQLLNILRESNVDPKEFTHEFLDDVISFIDDIDMRLLRNMVNEYVIYKGNLNTKGQSACDKLLALIIYKNLYPKDFVHLHKREGKLYRFLSKKEMYIESAVKELDAKISELEKQIEFIKLEKAENANELRAVYVNKLRDLIPKILSIEIDGSYVEMNELTHERKFNKLQSIRNFDYEYHYGYDKRTGSWGKGFSALENEVNKKFTFRERESFIIQRSSEEQNRIKKELQRLIDQKNRLKSQDLKQIFSIADIGEYLNEFDNNKLIRLLLKNGYIDESYYDYISYFHEVNITRKDHEFIRSVKLGVENPYTYELTEYQGVIKKLGDRFFTRSAILNFGLVDFLFQNCFAYKSKLDLFVSQLVDESNKSVRFIDEYVKRKDAKHEQLIKALVKRWPEFWHYLKTKSNYPEERLNQYQFLLLKFTDLHEINTLNIDNVLTDSISKQKDLREFLGIDLEKMSKILDLLEVKFTEIGLFASKSQDLYDLICKKQFYEINPLMIDQMLNSRQNKTEIETSYTNVLATEDKLFMEYIESNIELFVEDILLNEELSVSEEEQGIIKLLNNDSINDDLKTRLIENVDFKISDLSSIEGILQKQGIIDESKMDVSWDNVIHYYEYLGLGKFDVFLVDYLNDEFVFSKLIKTKIQTSDVISEELVKEFTIHIIQCDELTLDSYSNLLLSTTYTWNNIGLSGLAVDKIELLVKYDKLTFSVDNFSSLKELTTVGHILLSIKNQSIFFEQIDDLNLEVEDYGLLLENDKFNKQFKNRLISSMDQSIFTSQTLAAKICKVLGVTEVIDIDYQGIKHLFENSHSTENRVRLLLVYFDQLSKPEIEVLIRSLPEPYPVMFEKMKKPKFTLNDYNLELINKLEEMGLISSKTIDEEKQIIKVVANY